MNCGTENVFVPNAIIFCGAFTGRMNPKLITYCRIIVMPITFRPGVETFLRTSIIIGIIAAARAVALANPRCIIIRKAAKVSTIRSAGAVLRPKRDTIALASHTPALVETIAEPRLMPIPKRNRVPQAILC